LPLDPSIRGRSAIAAAATPFRLRAALLLVAGAAGCDVGDPITSTQELPENPGVIVAGAAAVSSSGGLVWSRDGRVLTFETDAGTLVAVDVTAGLVSTRDGPRDRHEEMSPAAAGGAIHFLADRANGYRSAYRLPEGAGAIRLTDRAPGTQPIIPGDGTLVLGGPEDRQVAFIVEPDSLFVFGVATGDRRFVAPGCTRIVVFSPDGGSVLCKRPAQGSFGLFDLDDGSTATVTLQPGERESQLLHTRWTQGDSLRSLYRTVTRFRIRNVTTGDAFSIWIPFFFEGVRETDFRNWSWSADGAHFVFWVHECLKLDQLGGCSRGQSVLYAVDFDGNTGRPVVVVKGERGAEQVALSPDGKRVAFVFEGRLHLQTIS